MVRKRRARGRGPSRWWRASEALAKVAAGCASLLVLGSVIEARPGAVLGVGWTGLAWALVGVVAGVVGVRCARRAAFIEQAATAAADTTRPPAGTGPPAGPENSRSGAEGRLQSLTVVSGDKDPTKSGGA